MFLVCETSEPPTSQFGSPAVEECGLASFALSVVSMKQEKEKDIMCIAVYVAPSI